MLRQPIPLDDVLVRFNHLWNQKGLILTPGDFAAGQFNSMPIGWGSLGKMWGAPFVQVLVRPSRYTYELMERYQTFTLSAIPDHYRQAVEYLGSRSGREVNKIDEAGLTPIPSTQIQAPGFDEADLILECRKIYWDDLKPDRFLAPDIDMNYPDGDYHRIYIGEVLAVSGTTDYQV